MVLLPSEVVPLHIFEERYKTMIAECLEERREFGIVWLADDGLKEIGCTRADRGGARARAGRPHEHPRARRRLRSSCSSARKTSSIPPGRSSSSTRAPTTSTTEVGEEARERYADLLERITDERPEEAALAELSAYEMAASVEIDPQLKQGLLELRSEEERLRLLARLFKDGIEATRGRGAHRRAGPRERQGQLEVA